MKTSLYIVIILLLFASCDSETDTRNFDSLLGSWELKTVIYQGDIVILIPSKVTLSFSQESKRLIFSGNSTCNFYGGLVTNFNSETIALSNMFTTEIACSPDNLNTFENDYYKWIIEVNEYQIDGQKLNLFSNDTRLYFEVDTTQ